MRFAPKMFLATLIVLALPVLALAQGHQFPSKTICDVRLDNDMDCVADAAATADTVCVQGIVLAWKEFGARGAGAIWDPVSGCCISIFDITNAPMYAAGDMIEVCGWVGAFAGLDEIVDNPADGTDPTTVLISRDNTSKCVPVSSADLADSSPTAEALESCCVSICGSFTATGLFAAGNANYDFVAADGDSIVIRVDSDTGIGGTPIPVGSVTVSGILGQFDGFASDCSGYQLLPRSTADFAPTTCTVAVQDKAWGEIKATYRDED